MLEEINNFSDSVSCLIVSKNSSNFFEQLEDFKKVNSLKSEYNCIGFYKKIPIITTDYLKENEVYALYKGKQQFDVETIFVKEEMKESNTDDNK